MLQKLKVKRLLMSKIFLKPPILQVGQGLFMCMVIIPKSSIQSLRTILLQMMVGLFTLRVGTLLLKIQPYMITLQSMVQYSSKVQIQELPIQTFSTTMQSMVQEFMS